MKSSEVLTPLQRKVLDVLFGDPWFRRYFYLTGGTALSAFYLQHRYSEDLDFFSHSIELTPVVHLMESCAKKLAVTCTRQQTSPGFQRYLIGNELKVDVVADISFRIDSPELIENYMVDCLKNIAVNKVGTLLSRLDAKDYVDLYFLLDKKGFDIWELFPLAQKKDGGLEPFIWASLIGSVDDLSILPRMIVPLSLEELKDFYHQLRDQILDAIKPGS